MLHTTFVRHGNWLSFVAGLALPFAFAPFGQFWLVPLLLALLVATWDEATPRQAAWRGFLFGFGAFLFGTHWLYVSLHVFGKAPLLLAIPLMAALMALMAAYTAAVGYLVTRFVPRGGWRWLIAIPATWVLAEWLRSWVLTGFPWLSLGYTTTDSPLAGWIPLGGVFAASLAMAVSAGAIRALFEPRLRLLAAAVLLSMWAGGFALQQVAWTNATERELQVSLIQGAIPQDRKWLPEELIPTMRLYRDRTVENWDSDLIVWPEAAIPAWRSSLSEFFDSMREQGQQTDTGIVVGVIEYDLDDNAAYNGVVGLDETVTTYYKRHLVPFGEYFPVPSFIREWMRLQSLPHSDYTPGGDDQSPLLVAGEPIAASICYEDVFGNELRMMLPAATLLVNVSNDAWFGESIAPHQHLQIARVRAIEAGRYLLRSTNTGLTAVIGPRGHIESQIPQFETTVLTTRVRPFTGATPYVRFGDWPVVVLVLAGMVVAGLGARRSRA
ncbi:MAG: apolipoprotein N-acyltransferase [Gammaproteobacteria bacterium]|nr:apolipoprotein N-acyltransferase [Gammaproteobacteria bacterium]